MSSELSLRDRSVWSMLLGTPIERCVRAKRHLHCKDRWRFLEFFVSYIVFARQRSCSRSQLFHSWRPHLSRKCWWPHPNGLHEFFCVVMTLQVSYQLLLSTPPYQMINTNYRWGRPRTLPFSLMVRQKGSQNNKARGCMCRFMQWWWGGWRRQCPTDQGGRPGCCSSWPSKVLPARANTLVLWPNTNSNSNSWTTFTGRGERGTCTK